MDARPDQKKQKVRDAAQAGELTILNLLLSMRGAAPDRFLEAPFLEV